jgi:hypothetical protein
MREIDNIVKKVLMESLNEKAEELTKKINGEMDEDFGPEDYDYEQEDMPDYRRFKKLLDKKLNMDTDDSLSDIELEEETDVMSGEFDYVQEKECMEGDCGEMKEGEKFRKALKRAYTKKHPGEKFPASLKKKYDYEGEEDDEDDDEDEEYSKGQKYIAKQAKPTNKIDAKDFEVLRSNKKETKESIEGDEMEEGNAFTGALARAKEEGKGTFKVGNKEFDVKNESYKYTINFGGEELTLSENELVSMIEEIIIEEKKTNLKSSGGRSKGMVEYDRVHKKDDDINKKANQESFKKMRDYVKAGSKGSFEENPKHFPKGNGQLAKMDKKSYIPSDAVEEYIDTFAYGGGMLDLDPDEVGYNEDWLEKTIEGSEMTGNSPKYANAEDTGLGKKLNKRRKLGLYNQEKRKSYNRVKQPVDIAGENTKSGKLDNMFKKLGESTEEKQILSEEMMKMKNMMGYNKKTQ